jgi:hypothetical protein
MENVVLQYVFSTKGATLSASPPPDGFAVANLGQTPQAFIVPKSTSTESAIHFRRR